MFVIRIKLLLLTEFLTGGIDTTSNCAAFFLYALARNQDKQEKVRREIIEAIDTYSINGKVILSNLVFFTKLKLKLQ